MELKEKIINQAIIMLKNEGLIFSVDDLAKKLRIGKPTIYQFFKNKEELSKAVFLKIYSDIIEELNNANNELEIIECLKKTLEYSDRRLFNRYSINETIYEMVLEKVNECKKIALEKLLEKVNIAHFEHYIDFLCVSIRECLNQNIDISLLEPILLR